MTNGYFVDGFNRANGPLVGSTAEVGGVWDPAYNSAGPYIENNVLVIEGGASLHSTPQADPQTVQMTGKFTVPDAGAWRFAISPLILVDLPNTGLMHSMWLQVEYQVTSDGTAYFQWNLDDRATEFPDWITYPLPAPPVFERGSTHVMSLSLDRADGAMAVIVDGVTVGEAVMEAGHLAKITDMIAAGQQVISYLGAEGSPRIVVDDYNWSGTVAPVPAPTGVSGWVFGMVVSA